MKKLLYNLLKKLFKENKNKTSEYTIVKVKVISKGISGITTNIELYIDNNKEYEYIGQTNYVGCIKEFKFDIRINKNNFNKDELINILNDIIKYPSTLKLSYYYYNTLCKYEG